jgi:polyribonucleotide nucleotidyltransferase
MQSKEYELEIGGKTITAIFSDLAEQANGSVILKCEGTVVMATAVISKSGDSNPGYFNLTVEYLEKFYAAGKILGSQFNRREGRPSDQAVLASRMIDRTIRPLFDQNIKNAVQVIVTVIALGKTDPKTLGINAASIALHVSDIPWAGPIGAVHISKTSADTTIQINNYIPNNDEPVYTLDLLVCGKDKTINMIEAMSFELKDEEMVACFEKASLEVSKWETFQGKVRDELGKTKIIFTKTEVSDDVKELFNSKIKPMLEAKLFSKESKKVANESEALWKEIVKEKYPDDTNKENKFAAEDYLHHYLDEAFHNAALRDGTRADGRALDQIRALYGKAGGISEYLHGSGIFYRGETHVISVLALAGPEGMYAIDGMEASLKKRFMHHYNFPPYSGGETGRLGGINRREMGHGFLVEKALTPVLPDKISFPYTIRVVSESVASNGSTSQASICASTIALMDGGVPIKTPVAGISVGLMLAEDKQKYALLSDIQGPEDHYGDMDFKVAGTKDGITAIQLDVKVDGISIPILREALGRAKSARLQILEVIQKEISAPRANISAHAPKIMVIKIKKDQIGMIIGPGGKNINEIREKTGTEITIEEDGSVFITGKDGGAEEAYKIIESMTHEYKPGDLATGTVVKLMEFGAFVNIGGGTEGLVHVSEIAPFRIIKVSDILKEGDKVPVKLIKVDERGRLNFSIREADENFFKPKV